MSWSVVDGMAQSAPPWDDKIPGFHADFLLDHFMSALLPDFGYACEVGALDGTTSSVCLHFEEKGWIVLCVEPNPLHEASGRAARKLWRSVAAGAKNGRATYTADTAGEKYASNSGLAPRLWPYRDDAQAFEVEVRTVDRLLEEAGFPRLDLLTIDTEGWEPEVLKGCDLNRWRPTVLCFEDVGTKLPIPDGYAEVGRFHVDRVFRRLDRGGAL